ncbi:MAG: hypothetical protein AAGJ53_04995 [Pseudomonadota bacterium]
MADEVSNITPVEAYWRGVRHGLELRDRMDEAGKSPSFDIIRAETVRNMAYGRYGDHTVRSLLREAQEICSNEPNDPRLSRIFPKNAQLESLEQSVSRGKRALGWPDDWLRQALDDRLG